MIVISNPIAVTNEVNIIQALFENGLELFHVRKPDYSEKEMKAFLSEIKADFRQQLVLHSHHQLASAFGINRIHFTEKNRSEISGSPTRFPKPCRYSLDDYKKNGFTVSTSTHLISDFNALSDVFEYAFLSPVVESISKENYSPTVDYTTELQKRTNYKTKLIALGGIAPENCKKALEYGFEDVALLGAIWNTNKPIENFKACQQIVHSY